MTHAPQRAPAAPAAAGPFFVKTPSSRRRGGWACAGAPGGASRAAAAGSLQDIWDTATNTLDISYQTAKSTLPVWGRWKIFWNSVTAAWVAGP